MTHYTSGALDEELRVETGAAAHFLPPLCQNRVRRPPCPCPIRRSRNGRPGAPGALLRRDVLYSSHLVDWRAANTVWGRCQGWPAPGATQAHPLAAENEQLRRRNARLADRAAEQCRRVRHIFAADEADVDRRSVGRQDELGCSVSTGGRPIRSRLLRTSSLSEPPATTFETSRCVHGPCLRAPTSRPPGPAVSGAQHDRSHRFGGCPPAIGEVGAGCPMLEVVSSFDRRPSPPLSTITWRLGNAFAQGGPSRHPLSATGSTACRPRGPQHPPSASPGPRGSGPLRAPQRCRGPADGPR